MATPPRPTLGSPPTGLEPPPYALYNVEVFEWESVPSNLFMKSRGGVETQNNNYLWEAR